MNYSIQESTEAINMSPKDHIKLYNALSNLPKISSIWLSILVELYNRASGFIENYSLDNENKDYLIDYFISLIKKQNKMITNEDFLHSISHSDIFYFSAINIEMKTSWNICIESFDCYIIKNPTALLYIADSHTKNIDDFNKEIISIVNIVNK